MNLTIDIGNSLVKVIVFDDTNPVFRKVYKRLTPLQINRLRKNFNITGGMVSSVIKVNKAIDKALMKIPNFRTLSSSVPLPVKNLYKTPETLGNDRLANAVAAAFLYPGKNVLVIDAGTCVKYDFINSDNEYIGGSISPGMEMRFKALHKFTGRLPLVKEMNVKVMTGITTESAIQTGVMIGMIEEIKGFITRYNMKYPLVKVILTGGDAHHFEEELNLSIFAAADLVNIGLNQIIKFNAGKKPKK